MVLSYLIYDNYYFLFDCYLYFYLFTHIWYIPCKSLLSSLPFFTNCMHDMILIFFFPIAVVLVEAHDRQRSKEGDQI